MQTWEEMTDQQRFAIRALWGAEDSRRDTFENVVLGKEDAQVREWWESLTDAERSELYSEAAWGDA